LDPQGNYSVVSVSVPPDQQDGNIWTWNLGELPSRGSGEVEITVKVNEPLPNNWLVSNQAALFSPEGEPFHTGVVTHTVMNLDDGGLPVDMVDLAITGLMWEPSTPPAGIWPRFCMTVTNVGTADALPLPDELGFWLSLYIKPNPSDPPLWPSDHDWGYCLDGCATVRPSYVAYVAQLPAGGQVQDVCFQPQAPTDPLAPDYPAQGVYDVYAQVDLAFDGDNLYWGRYAEDSEANNLVQGIMILGDLPTENNIYLPLIFRSAP
jgi:hypothetical protein